MPVKFTYSIGTGRWNNNSPTVAVGGNLLRGVEETPPSVALSSLSDRALVTGLVASLKGPHCEAFHPAAKSPPRGATRKTTLEKPTRVGWGRSHLK